ncbi:conserved hypothetical protein [Candidatus Terasakiella magnetica]|nr:conserved hypothetical protein [Candidatus Terasakiella magnetica]
MAGSTAKLRARLAEFSQSQDEAIGLGDAALVLAALDRQGAETAPYQDYLDALATEVKAALGGGDGACEILAGSLFEVIGRIHRFRVDDRDDDDVGNANLMTVIDRRRGVPDVLGLLCLDVARRAGLTVEGLSFPIHFLVRLSDADGRRLIVDPSACGQVVEPAQMRALLKASQGTSAELEPMHYTAMNNRDALIRLQTDIKLRHLRTGRVDLALAVVESMLLFAPTVALLWREAGLMHLRLGNTRPAIAALEHFITQTPNAQAKARTLALLAELKGHLH